MNSVVPSFVFLCQAGGGHGGWARRKRSRPLGVTPRADAPECGGRELAGRRAHWALRTRPARTGAPSYPPSGTSSRRLRKSPGPHGHHRPLGSENWDGGGSSMHYGLVQQ
ncbi:hypothetical protein G5B35_02490 [Parapusillimonas sp. SGNA-6]|nr:hypothetical protein [Parapusillimonas sp. SGNA-6]